MKKLENLRLIGLFSATALFGGCVSFGGAEPPPFLLSLSPDAVVAAGAEQTGPKSGAVVVRLPTTPQKLNNLRVPVQTNATGIAYLKEAVWVDKPARLFQDLLIETVSAKNGRMVLTSAQASGKAETYVSGELVNFGLDGPGLVVTVTYDAVKIRDGQPVEKKRFEATENVFAAEPAPVGEALNSAANAVAAEVADWIG